MITEKDMEDVYQRTVKDMYLLGSDLIGATAIPAVETYTDSATVRAVQTTLKAKGFDPGPVDGVYGPKTAAAITAMQSAAGIPQTGEIDYGVLSALRVPTPTPPALQTTIAPSALTPVPTLTASPGAPKASGVPPWKIAFGVGGAGLLLTGLVLLAVRR